MATPGELVARVASALAVPEVTVGIYYRNLREADLVTKGGRGRSAPLSTYVDAARLLISLMVSDTAVQAAAETQKFAALPLTHLSPGEADFPGFSERDLDGKPFDVAVAGVVELLGAPERASLVLDEVYDLTITARSNITAEISLAGITFFYDDLPADWTKAETGAVVSLLRMNQMERPPAVLLTQRSVGGGSLAKIAACIATPRPRRR